MVSYGHRSPEFFLELCFFGIIGRWGNLNIHSVFLPSTTIEPTYFRHENQ